MPDNKPKNTDLVFSKDFNNQENKGTLDTFEKTGAIDSSFGNTSFGDSKYDIENTTKSEDIKSGEFNYLRGQRQSNIKKWGAGIARASAKLGTRTLNGVISPIYGIGSAIKNADWSKIWDNDVTNLSQEAEKKIDEAVPMYSTKAAEDAKGFSKLAYVNTWAGDILDGMSYSGAAMLSGATYTKALSAASKLASLDKLGMSVAEAMGMTTKIEDAADKTKFVIDLTDKAKKLKNGLNNGAINMIGAATEASANSLNDANEFERQMRDELSNHGERELTDEEIAHIKELRKSVGNASYCFNLPVITGANILTFGKTMLGSTATEKSLLKGAAARTEKDLVAGGYKAAELSSVQKILDKTYGLRKVVGKTVPEGIEEWEQLVVTKGVNDFYSKKYYNPEYNDFQESFSKGLNEAMSSEGLENFLVGAISGGIFGNVTQIKTEGLKSYKNPYNDQAVNKALDYLNEIKGEDAYKETVGMLNRHASLSEQQDQAVAENNEFEIQNNKSDMLINYVNHMINAGKVEDLKSELDSYKHLSNEEFEQILGIELSKDKLTGLKESVGTYLNKRLDKVGKIEQLSNTLDEVYPDLKPNIKDRFMYTAWTLEDAQDRVNAIQQDINNKLTKSFGVDNGGLSALNILPNLTNVNASNVKETIKALENDNNISPLIRQDVVNKVQDLVKLKDRQQQFIAEYKALSNPKLQELLDAKDNAVEQEVSDKVAEHKIKQQVVEKTTPVNVAEEGMPVDNSTLSSFAEDEGEALSTDEVIKYLGDKIINRVEGEQFTPGEQQHYENNKEAIEAYIISKQTGVTERATIVTTPVAEENDEALSNGVTTALDNTVNQDEELTTIASVSTKEFLSKRANALMSKFFKFGEKVKTWLRDENGEVVEESGEEFSKKNNTPEVSRDINHPNVATVGTTVTYNHNGKDIWMTDPKGLVVGYIGLENPLPLNASDEVIAAREELIKNRKEILSKPSGTISTTIKYKGNGKLLTKIDQNNQLILDQAPSTRPQDMIDGRPLFLYDDGESLSAKNINEEQAAVVNEFKGTTFSKENPVAGGTRIGVGRIYQAVKTANGEWYVIPVYTNLVKDLANFDDISKLVLTTFKDNIVDANTSNYSKIINTLQPFVFVTNHSRYSKNPNVVRIIEDKEHQNEGFVSVGGVKISFNDLKEGINTDKFIQALGTVRANLSIDSLNDPKYTRTLIQNNGLVTNAYTDSTGNYYVQPYIEVVGLTQPEETTSVQNVTSNNESSFEDKKANIERRRQEELEGYYGYGSIVKRLLSEHKPTLALSQLYFTGDNDIEITVDGKKYKIVKDGKYLAKNVIDKSGNIVAKFSVSNGTSDVIEDRGLMNKKTFYDFISRIENDIPSEYRQKLIDKINAKYDAEYIDKVKKGEFTKQQAKDALKEINRLTPELEKQIDDAELTALERRRQEVRNAIQKAGEGEGGQFIVTLLDGTKENAARISLVGNELGIGNKGDIVDLSIIKKVENPDGTILYDAELATLEETSGVSGSALKDVEGKKADIERRRQEKLENIFKSPSTVNTNFKLETKKAPNGNVYNYITLHLSNWENKDSDVAKVIKSLLDYTRGMKPGEIIMSGNYQRVVENSAIWYPLIATTDYLQKGKYKENFEKQTNVLLKKSELSIQEINAKYDAELADLESPKVESTNPFAGKAMTDEIDFDSSDAPAFSRTKLEGSKVNQKSKDILKKILPGLQLADEKLIEEVGGNLKDTYGMFHNMLIYLFKGATNQTMFHEAFHGVFRNILSDTERIAVLNEAQVKYDAPNAERLEFLRQAPGNEKLNTQALTQLHYEERLADDFAKFADGEVNPSLGQRILNFFKKIFNLFNIFRNSNTSQIQEVFENTIKGSYAKRSIAASLLNKAIDLNKFGNAYSRVFTDGSIPLSAELDRTNAIANVLLAKVSEQVAKGTELKNVDVNAIANTIRNHYLKVSNEEALKPEAERNMNKGVLAYQVANRFAELLENAKRQISLTKKINFKGNFVDTSIIEEEEGVVDTNRENEDTNKLDSDKGKGFQEMTAISGIRTATHEIKLFLSNLPVLKDGVVQRDSFGFPLYHSFEKIYYKLEQSLVGTTTFNEQFAIMKSLAKFSPEINQVVEAIESITDKQQLTNFKQQFAANFNKQVLNYKLMTYTKKGNKFEFKMFDPNRKDVAVNLNTQWTATNITDPTNKETDDIRVFNDKLAVYEVSKEKVKSLIEKYWSNINGKNMLDEAYKATVDNTYELAHKLGISLSYDTVQEYAKLDDKNLKDLTMTLLHYADTMYISDFGKNKTSARNFLNQLIKLETNVQTELFTSSFNNVENSVVYAIQHQSFASKLVRSLTNNSSASLALNDKLQSDPINYKNFVLEHTKGLEMFPIDGLKMQGDNIEGKKFNQIHRDDYLAMIINMFNNDLDKDKLGTEARAVYAPIIPAEKGLAFAFAGSKINVGLDENGKLDKNSLIHSQFEQLVFNELARIRQVMIDIKDNKKTPENLINNYHLGKKLGLQFNMTDAISPILKVKLDTIIEGTLDQTIAKGVNPSTFVQGLIQGELLEEVKNAIHDNLQSIIDKHLELAEQGNVIYKDEKGNYVTNKFAGKVENVITNWALNSSLFNASVSTLINGDSAFYKGAEDNGKRFYQGYSMLKFADTSIIDNSFKYLTGGKMKINVIKDVELASLSVPVLEEFAELTGNSNIAKLAKEEYDTTYDAKGNKKEPINAADAQIFVSVGIYQELERLFGNDSPELREGFTNADIADALNRKQDKGILTIKKPFFYGVQYDNKLKRYVPIQVKCSIFPISNKFVKNNPLLAKHKALMDADVNYPQVIAFESTMKALSPFKANIQDPSNPSIVELDLNNYGEQVANPDHMSDSHNDSMRQLEMLFYGIVENDKDYIGKSGRELKNEIALLRKANIEESLEEVVKAFKGNQKELMKFIQDAISSRNATSIMEDVFTQDANGKFQYDLDLINPKTTIQLISSIFSDRVIRQKFTGGSAPQASSVGLQIAPKESNYKNAAEFQAAVDESKSLTEIQSSLKWIRKADNKSIDYIEAYAPAHAKEFFNADGTIKDNIPDELKQMLVYRIPTEGAHSMMAVKVVGFLPEEYGGAMLLPLEVTKQFGADFDFDKIFFISKEFYSTKEGLKTYKYISGDSERDILARYKALINHTLINNPEAKKLVKEANSELEEFDYELDYNDKIQVLLDNGILPHLDDFRKLSVVEQNIKPARNNRLLENYMQILRSSNMLESLITPSGPGAIADVYDAVKEPIKIGNFFTPLYQVFNKDLFHKISMLKGVAALQVSGHAWATEGNLKVKDKVVGDKTIEQGVKVKGKGIYNNLSRVMSDTNSKIVEELSSMMAVILDAVKTPDQLPSIGISMKTLPMWSYLVRLGLGSRVASQFTSQQAIKDLSILLEANDIQLKDKTFVKQDINNIKQKYNQLYTDAYNALYEKTEQEAKINANASSLLQKLDKIHPDMVSNFKQLSLEDLEKFTGKKESISKLQGKDKLDYLILQLTVLNIFDDSQATIKELNQLNQLFSINKETGPNFEDVNGKLAIYRNLSQKDTLIDGIEPLLHSDAIYPYIKTVEAQMDVMQDHYNFASPFFNAVKDRVAQSQVLGNNISLTSLKDEDRNIVNGFVQAYLDAEHTFKPLFDGSERISRKDFLTDLKLLLSSRIHAEHKFKVLGDLTISEKEQEWLKAMTLFKSLEVVNIKNSNEAYAALKGGRYELHQKELMINDITRLYNSKFKPLAEALVYHAFENTGFYTGVNSYTSYIHPSVLQSMGLVNDRNKVKPTLQSNYYNPEVLDNIIDNIVDQLVRNNAKKFTKVYDNEKGLFTVIDGGKTLVLNKESKDKSKLAEITNGDQVVKYIRFVLDEDYTPIYKLDDTTDDQVTFRQVTYLGSPGKLVEINPFKEPQTALPNNRYEKFTTKAEVKASNLDQFKEWAEDEVVKIPEIPSNEPNADNSENIADGQMEKPMSEDQLAMWSEEENLENSKNNVTLTSMNIDFQEEPTTGYRQRTINNAKADATIAIAVDFNSAGEKLTKSSVLNQNKKYIPIDANTLTVTKERVDKIIEQLNSINKSTEKINIYAGTNENAELSNFAVRPFNYKGIIYKTVEGAFQAAKLDYAEKSQSYNDEKVTTEEYKKSFSNLSGNLAKQQGRRIKGLDTKTWDANSSRIMKDLLLESFKQNPQALQKLLATSNAELTHTQDKGKWGTEFPKLLMEVRQELGGQKQSEGISLNIAGNGIYTMKGKYTQQQVDDFTYELLKAIIDRGSIKNSNEKLIPLTSNFTRESVKNDSDYIYLFTDNAKRTSGKSSIDASSWYRQKYTKSEPLKFPSITQAVIRGLNNAFPITTMVDDNRTQWTDAKFEEYKTIIDDEINQIKKQLSKFKGIKFASENPFGKGKISNMKQSAPKIWNYMNQKLAEIGIDNTGNIPVVISSKENLLPLNTKIESIRSGGQTGFDEAGVKAGVKLGLPTIILAPKGWTFRNVNGQDISNEQQFKNRFNINSLQSEEKIVPLAIDFKIQDLKLNIDRDMEKGYISEAKRNEMFELINSTKVTNDKEFGDLINKLCR